MLISLTASTVAPTSVSSELSSDGEDSEEAAIEFMSLNCSANPGPIGSSAATAKVENLDRFILEAADSIRHVWGAIPV